MRLEECANNKIENSLLEVVEMAIKSKQEKEAKKTENIEETPPGEKLTWNVTAEQIARINAGDRAALDAFYFDPDNFRRLTYSAHKFMRHKFYLKSVISYEDLMQQVYYDLRAGMVKLRPYDKAISFTIYHSFQFAAVGGVDEVFIPHRKEEDVKKG